MPEQINDAFSQYLNYLDAERKRNREAEDAELDKRIALTHDLISGPGANPARTAQGLADIMALYKVKGGKGKPAKGFGGMMGETQLPNTTLLAGLIHGSIPMQGRTTEAVPKPKSPYEQGMMPEASTQLPGLKTTLSGDQYPNHNEQDFQKKYGAVAQQYGLNSNPDDPAQFYDYRAAMNTGAAPDADGHWPSDFKKPGHPNMIVEGMNTQTGRPAGEEVLNAPVMIPPEPIQAPPSAKGMLSAARQMQQYNAGPKTRPVANQPMRIDPDELAEQEGRAEGIKQTATAKGKRAGDLEALTEMFGKDEALQIVKRQVMGTSGNAQDQDAGFWNVDGKTVKAVRVFNPAYGMFTTLDALTRLPLPPSATPMATPSSSTETDPTSYKEYERYTADEKARGNTKILGYNDWLTMDANRKRPTTNVQVAPGMTNNDRTAFNNIVNRYQMSPLVKAKDRTITLTKNIHQLEANPSNPAAQLALGYSFIQALDTYQSAVREGELRNLTTIDSKLGNLQLWAQQITTGKLMRPEVALQIAQAAKELTMAINEGAKNKEPQFRSQAQINGLGGQWDEYVKGFSQPGAAAGAGAGANDQAIMDYFRGTDKK